MKVKVGDTIFDGEDQPVMVILSDMDKQNILSMGKDATKYCSYPDNMDINEIKEFMRTEES
jgi:hypothetical protein